MSNTEHLKNLGSNTQYLYDNPSANTLETFFYEADHYQVVTFLTDEFTSLCPKTGQPDFANINITYVPRKLGVESKSLKLYLFSYRNHGSFHEDCVAQMTNDIFSRIDPWYLRVIGDFTRRGGIAIKPVSERYAAELKDGSKDDIFKLIEMTDRLQYKR